MALHDNQILSKAALMTDGGSAVTDISSVLADIFSEVKKSGDLLSKIKDSTEGDLAEMKCYKERVGPVEVYIRTSFVSVCDIDTVKQEFKCEFYMSVRWNEPELNGKTEDDIIEWEKYWDPRIHIFNAASYNTCKKTQKLRICKSDAQNEAPEVVQDFHIKGTFKEGLEVNDFPFDYQDLTIVLTSNWEVGKVKLLKDPKQDDNIRTWNFTGKQEWDLQQHVLVERGETPKEKASSPCIFPLYSVKLHARRQYAFYIYNIALLMCLITALTFTTFAVSVDSTGGRIKITLTLLLTSVAFKYHVHQFVPTVSYVTFLGKYVLSCFIFQFGMAAIHNSVAGLITSTKSLEIFELGCLYGGLFVFLAIHIVFATMSIAKVKEVKDKMLSHENEYEKSNKNQRGKPQFL